ncbi:alpha/beta fold hydrolase [Halomonas lysinitropha]|uniref:Pimeloyl-[acyl-carrier protein] methyl ester esterase n=1 Tax=Halomonas lysinitropha TaxID=2607506 RepID=A0A5K1I7Z4_9GAMM|nr:alpha/beta fold hydrolase [Halomonas lysinitropha]VVZ97396.1 Pimeloyl-[acyl-carrier protein] methyl ester esterase [Halomonas lysinitropha]
MTPLVLLSGWGCDARLWQPLAGHWSEALAVSAPDWPGYGARSPLANPGSLAQMAKEMADELTADAIWVGWSLGGLLAAALLDHLPAPRALVLIGMGGDFCHEEGISTAELRAFQRAFARAPDTTHRYFLRWQLRGEPDPRAAHRQLRELLDDHGGVDRNTLAAGLDQLAELDNGDRLVGAPCPIWRVAGERDPLLAPARRESADHRLSHAGHCPMLSQPASLAACLAGIASAVEPSP